jgi:hypothetical protein
MGDGSQTILEDTKMIPTIALCVLLAAIPAPGSGKATIGRTMDLMPAAGQVEGWQMEGRKTYATNRALYDYMNGGAEIYIDYGFQDVAVGEWMSPEGDPLKVEIYRLGSPKSAYGMFTQDAWGEPSDVGQGGRLQGGTLRFWKGPYLVRVFMWRGYQDHMDVILDTGRWIANSIPNAGEIPALVEYLPGDGLSEQGAHFFHTALTLGTFYYLGDEDPLGLSRETDGVIGEYVLGDEGNAFLVLIAYPDESGAREGFESFVTFAASAAEAIERDADSAVLASDDGLIQAARCKGSFLGLGLDFPSKDSLPRLFDKMMDGLGTRTRASGGLTTNETTECQK